MGGGPTLRGRRWVSCEKAKQQCWWPLDGSRATSQATAAAIIFNWSVIFIMTTNINLYLILVNTIMSLLPPRPDVFISCSVSVNRIKSILMKGELRYRYSTSLHNVNTCTHVHRPSWQVLFRPPPTNWNPCNPAQCGLGGRSEHCNLWNRCFS